MRIFAKTTPGILTALACFLTMSATAFSATGKPVVVSARDFIGGFSTNRKTEVVAANQQRSFVVSSGKAATIFNQASAIVLTDFPVAPNSDAVVELERSRPLIDGETVFMKNGQPVDRSLTAPVIQTFRGKIRGEEDSKVVISMINGNMIGSVEHNNGERFVFSPLSESKKDAREHTLFAESALNISPEEMGFTCATSDEPVEGHTRRSTGKHSHDQLLSSELLEFQLAIETDFTLYQRFGRDYDRMESYVLSAVAMVSSIYEDEINVTFVVTHFGHWTTQDPYAAGGDISTMLDNFSQYWFNNKSSVKRNIAHLITGPGSTSVGGIAHLDALCQKFSGYSVSGIHANYSYPTTSYSWDVNVIAHELGHNFGSPHTHNCWFWDVPLDSCVSRDPNSAAFAGDACTTDPPVRAAGSIMSYCHLLNGRVELTFTPPVIDVIRSGAEQAWCITAPAEPKIVIQNPLGNQLFSVGSTVDIRWTSARVNMVGIEYSTDGGETWHDIVESFAAATRKYTWTIPTIASTEMLVRVYDLNDHAVNDASTVAFEVRSPALTISYPVGSERLAQKMEVTVKWEKILVQSVAIDFSSNNGATWETQVTGLTAREYKWIVPSLLTSEALVRVRDESNNEIISQSQPFSIGVPFITITAPVAGTRWETGSQQQIRWQSDFVEKIRIQYKLDGKEWKNIGPLILPAADGSYTWNIPNTLSQNVLLRIITVLVDNGPADTSEAFVITGTVDVKEPGVVAETFSIAPQPANDHVIISFSLASQVSSVRIAVRDVTGRIVAELMPEYHNAGSYTVELSTISFAQGVYFVSIETGGTTIIRPLTVLH